MEQPLQTNLQIMQSLYNAFGRRDIVGVFRFLAPEIELMQSEELPWGGAYRGHEGARALFAKLDLSLQSTLEIERYIRAGDSIAAVGWTQGTVNATGGVYRIPIVHLWKLANGLIERAQFLIDHPAMQNALGSRSN